MSGFHGTTILSVRRGEAVAVAGDGQVTLQDATIAKADAVKVRRLSVGEGREILVGFAGGAADALALLERFEGKAKEAPGNLKKAATELAKLWRTDRILRRLESLLAVADPSCSLLISGSGDVIEPSDGIIGIGSGGPYATAAARALLRRTELSASEIAGEALGVAAELCIYTNDRIHVETL